MLFGIGVVLFVLFANILRLRFGRVHRDVVFGPQLDARMEAIFEPFEGSQLPADALSSLELQADTAFRDIMTGVGLVPNGWSIHVTLDDVLGPVPHVHGPHGEVLTVVAFEHQLREGELQLGEPE